MTFLHRSSPISFPWARGPLLPVAPALLLLAACGGGGGGGGGAPAAPNRLEQSLNRLGVDTAKTPREAMPGMAVPEGYAPLGATARLARTDELMLFGIGLATPAMTNPAIVLELTDANGAATADVLHAENASAMPWAAENLVSRAQPATLRAPLAADVDGDGLQETAIVFQRGIETRIYLIDDAAHGFAVRDVQIASNPGVTNVAAAAGDLDGDGDDEVVVALTQNGSGEVQAFAFDGQQFAPAGPKHSYGPRVPNTTLHVQLCTGNLDLDRRDELVIAVNETNQSTGQARFAVLDDLAAGLAVLREGDFIGRDQNQQVTVGLCASVAIGDVDGDNVGEVLLGGVTDYVRFCNSKPYFLLALDDAAHGLADLAGHFFTHHFSGCNSPSDPRILTVHLHALDLDGDGRAEVLANQHVFQDFAEAAPWTEVMDWRLPDAVLWDQNAFGHFDRTTSSIVVGDFTGDDRDDVACYRQDSRNVDVYALPATQTAVTRVRRIPVPFTNSQVPGNPVLVPVDCDTDGAVLKYSAGEYALAFTEPVVLAALAAPPSKGGVGQNVNACFTAFGNTQTTIQERERSLTFSAGVSVGVNLDGGALTQSEFTLRETLTRSATRTVGSAYELSKTIVFTSAPTEDTVVFTTVPVDRYTYTVLSHPDPALVGHEVVVDLPRSPITLQAERGFYNRTVQPGDQQVGADVFAHVIGDPRSYPTVAQKNALLAGGGLQVGPQSVGQGGGSTEVTLQVGNAVSSGRELAVAFELDVEATAGGVLGGITVGSEATSSWRVTSGTSTTYTGVVGAIEAASFAANRYSFGLFTWVHRDPVTHQQFQVLHYWVE